MPKKMIFNEIDQQSLDSLLSLLEEPSSYIPTIDSKTTMTMNYHKKTKNKPLIGTVVTTAKSDLKYFGLFGRSEEEETDYNEDSSPFNSFFFR